MPSKRHKGAAFERDFCRQLSEWWSGGEHSDLFWRTSQSGGRATIRGRKGQRTKGHCGDICATCPEGEELLKVVTFELKRGYSRCTIQDVMDRGKRGATQEYQKWFTQAEASAKLAGSFSWMVVHKRDGREPMVWMPWELNTRLIYLTRYDLLLMATDWDGKDSANVFGVTLRKFFKEAKPEEFRRVATEEGRKK